MSRVDELRAALAEAELEEQLVAAKESGDVPEGDFRQLKDDLREARRVHRTIRAGQPPELAAGDATVRPDAIEATTTVPLGEVK